MKRMILALMCVLTLGAALSGCGKKDDTTYEFSASGDAIFLQTDTHVVSKTVQTGFDKDYYSAEELENDYIAPAVLEYNEKTAGYSFVYAKDLEAKEAETTSSSKDQDAVKTALPVAINEVAIKDQIASMTLEYATAADYLAFNAELLPEDAKLTLTSMADSAGVGNASWIDASTKEGVDQETALTIKDGYYIAELNFAANVQVEGKLIYVTQNVTVTGENSFSTNGSETSIIIFGK